MTETGPMNAKDARLALLAPHRAAILALAQAHHCRNVRVLQAMGWLAPGAEGGFDFLVDIDDETTGLDLGALIADLGDLLSRPVNVLTEAAIHPELRASLLADAVAL